MFVYFAEQNGKEGTKNNQRLLCIPDLWVFFKALQLTIIDEDCYYSQSNLTSVIGISTIMENLACSFLLFFFFFKKTDEILLKKAKKI